MFNKYFKIAWRNLLKNKVYTSMSIVGLATGFTAVVLILIWTQHELNFDDDEPQSESIYRLTINIDKGDWTMEGFPLLLADAAKKEIPEIAYMARLNDFNAPVFNINGYLAYEKKCAYVDGDWFRIFHYDFIEGNATSFAKKFTQYYFYQIISKKIFWEP